jgi:hypothetical protein
VLEVELDLALLDLVADRRQVDLTEPGAGGPDRGALALEQLAELVALLAGAAGEAVAGLDAVGVGLDVEVGPERGEQLGGPRLGLLGDLGGERAAAGGEGAFAELAGPGGDDGGPCRGRARRRAWARGR